MTNWCSNGYKPNQTWPGEVRLASGLAGGLRVYVDQQVFDTVGDISDPQIRTLIQNAIHEWESR
ncbi:MAG TPA: hypothetical protein ENN99_10980 [Chloroflexi bacterium]|nr:hypothetical protein [Chloroflexota bacterium]